MFQNVELHHNRHEVIKIDQKYSLISFSQEFLTAKHELI